MPKRFTLQLDWTYLKILAFGVFDCWENCGNWKEIYSFNIFGYWVGWKRMTEFISAKRLSIHHWTNILIGIIELIVIVLIKWAINLFSCMCLACRKILQESIPFVFPFLSSVMRCLAKRSRGNLREMIFCKWMRISGKYPFHLSNQSNIT